nr:hypothetical protein [Tanacetum cinerariifolium]
MSYKEPPIPPSGVNQQKPVEVTTDTESPNSNDIHPPTVQVEVKRIENEAKTQQKFSTMYCSSSRVQKSSTRFRKKAVRGSEKVQGSKIQSILEAEVAQDDWWIKNTMMRYEE